jgi:hypothetical protein
MFRVMNISRRGAEATADGPAFNRDKAAATAARQAADQEPA